MEGVQQDSDFVGVILKANLKEINELPMSDLAFGRALELLVVVLLAVHFKNDEDLFCRDEESLPVVLGDASLNLVVDHDFFVESLAVPSI